MNKGSETIQKLISDYKKHISKTHLKDEIYKWELLSKYSGRPNPNVSDFHNELKEVKFENLIYAMAGAVIIHIAKDRPEELSQLFKNLYDDSIDLSERVMSFNKGSLKLYKEIDGKHSHHQDERTIATYLTYHDPDKYTFYKYSYYKKYCKLLGIKVAKKNERLAHYLSLIDELIDKYIKNDTELIEQIKSIIPEYYDGTNHKILAQDILYQMFDKRGDKEVNYSSQLKEFLEQAKTENLKTKHFSKSFSKTSVKVSFGQGGVAKVPWISFLIEPNTTSNGIYPVYLFYKDLGILILAYGISETNLPSNNWNLSNEQTIKDYFEEKNFGKPYRYGESYVYRTYEVDNLPSNSILDNDLSNIISEYKNLTNTFKNEVELDGVNQMSFELSTFGNHCKDSGLIYSDQLITRFVASLLTKPIVILTGLSGSGKTKLAQAFVQWICETEEQYCIVPVGADWTNREPLLGYTDALNSKNYVLPENGALELIIRANEDESKPYFLILDEMNLRHVERYFADFLSVMESNEKFRLHSSDTPLDGGSNIEVAKEYSWPKNLFVIGTVNIDETTYMFSPKVLDRANTIEFRVNAEEMKSFLSSPTVLNMEDLIANGAGMAESFVDISKNKVISDTQDMKTALESFFVELQKVGAEFGYRTASEIQTLLGQIEQIDSACAEKDKIDIAIMQKLLPKLHGSRRKLLNTLNLLAKKCLEQEQETIFNERGVSTLEEGNTIKYKLSFDKIARMYKNAIENGFTSYAEA